MADDLRYRPPEVSRSLGRSRPGLREVTLRSPYGRIGVPSLRYDTMLFLSRCINA